LGGADNREKFMTVINRRAFVKGSGMTAAAAAVLPSVAAAKDSTLKSF
jgi:hypothetical protein